MNILQKRCAQLAKKLRGENMEKDYEQFLTKCPNKPEAVFPWHQDSQYWP